MKRAHEKRRRPPELFLEQLALGELPDERLRALEAEFGSELLARRRAELQADNERLATQFSQIALPSREQLARYEAAEAARRRRLRWLSFDSTLQRLVLAGGALLAVVGALVVVLPRPAPEVEDGTPRAAGEATRIKGLSPQLLCFRRRGEEVAPLASGDRVRAGDLLQLGYVAAGRAHGALLSIDGGGAVSQHFPVPPSTSTRLLQEGESLLGHAYELDDAPGFERFFLVTASKPLDVSALRAAASELAREPARARRQSLALPPGVEQKSLLLHKESR